MDINNQTGYHQKPHIMGFLTHIFSRFYLCYSNSYKANNLKVQNIATVLLPTVQQCIEFVLIYTIICDFKHHYRPAQSKFQKYCAIPCPLLWHVELCSTTMLWGYPSILWWRWLQWLCLTMILSWAAMMCYNVGHKLHSYQHYIG